MFKKLLSFSLCFTVVVFLGVIGTGCAKKPKTPEVVEEPKAVVEETPTAPEPEPEVATQPVEEHEGFKPVEEPPPPPKPNLANIRFEDVHFEYDKYDIMWSDKSKIQDMAQTLKDNPELFVTIEGHCDERGTNTYNRSLGDKRASTVQEFLYSLGVLKTRTSTVSYGEEKPLCTEQNESCWQKNRRAHFLVSIGSR